MLPNGILLLDYSSERLSYLPFSSDIHHRIGFSWHQKALQSWVYGGRLLRQFARVLPIPCLKSCQDFFQFLVQCWNAIRIYLRNESGVIIDNSEVEPIH